MNRVALAVCLSVLPAAASKWTGRTPAKLFKRGDMARIKAGKEESKFEEYAYFIIQQ